MGAAVVGLIVLTGMIGILLWILWRRKAVMQRKLNEPRLVHDELLRHLADSYAAAKAMLAACPSRTFPLPVLGVEPFLSIAVAAVDEFSKDGAASRSD